MADAINKFKLNTFQLKIIALILMLVDHVADILIPSELSICLIMRMIGRISAPLFMYCFAVGYKHTSSKQKYISRLAVFSIIMAFINSILHLIAPSNLTFNIWRPNMFLTFFLLACLIEWIDIALEDKSWFYWLIVLIVAAIIGFNTEYGWFALLTVLCFYYIKNNSVRDIVYVLGNTIMCIIERKYVQVFMVLSILLIGKCSDEKPKRSAKYLFYVFYPTHFIVLVLIRLLLER